MTAIDLKTLLELLQDDTDLLEALAEHGLIQAGAQAFGPDEVELILVSQTLVRELDVNWPGVDVILRMRRQLLVTRRRLAELSSNKDHE